MSFAKYRRESYPLSLPLFSLIEALYNSNMATGKVNGRKYWKFSQSFIDYDAVRKCQYRVIETVYVPEAQADLAAKFSALKSTWTNGGLVPESEVPDLSEGERDFFGLKKRLFDRSYRDL